MLIKLVKKMIRQVSLINITDRMISDLQGIALTGVPNEVCGVIHEHNIIHQYANTFCGDKRLGFDMEVDIKDCTIKAVWHSHPAGSIGPSPDDIQCMEQLATHGYNFPWLIITSKEITQWIYEPLHMSAHSQK